MIFPSQEVSQNRRIERALAAMIWVAMPFLLHLVATYPGGYGRLIKEPEYFFLAVVDVIGAVAIAYLACLAMARLTVASRGEAAAVRGNRKRAHRAWVLAVVSCFAATAVLLSISTWISMHWLQNPNNVVTTDALIQLLHRTGVLQEWASGYVHAFVAGLLVSLIIRRLARAPTAMDAPNTREIPRPNLPAATFAGYLILKGAMFLTAG
jgi:hypothetical protein